MSDLKQLSVMNGRDYISQIKARLRSDEQWAVMLHPSIVDHTRWGLTKLIASIDSQKLRVGVSDENTGWHRSIDGLRRLCKKRLDAMPPESESHNKETRKWKGYAAHLATVIEKIDPVALDDIKTPYGDMTAREWLSAREEKRA